MSRSTWHHVIRCCDSAARCQTVKPGLRVMIRADSDNARDVTWLSQSFSNTKTRDYRRLCAHLSPSQKVFPCLLIMIASKFTTNDPLGGTADMKTDDKT